MPSVATVVKGALLALPALCSAAGELGFALGFAKGEDHTNPDNCKTSADFIADLKAIKAQTSARTVRLYSTSDCDSQILPRVLPALKQEGFKVILGIWPTPEDHFQDEINALGNYPEQYKDVISGITVGSEALYRKEMKADELAKKIQTVKTKVKGTGIDVGFADSWNLIEQDSANPAIEASDLILANAFSYWQGIEISNATNTFKEDIMRALGHVQDVKKKTDVNFWVGETGWPTGGKDYDAAVPGEKNAETYWKSSVCGLVAWGFNVFVFEAFDESFKKTEKDNDVEKYWGVMTEDRKTKYDLSCDCPAKN
ncbi:glycoside hydrolase family 17 protein [Geopyxis carbonaria]|nr:glycoside hydrolase family 17 protein [Geopyxis carbonaria]